MPSVDIGSGGYGSFKIDLFMFPPQPPSWPLAHGGSHCFLSDGEPRPTLHANITPDRAASCTTGGVDINEPAHLKDAT